MLRTINESRSVPPAPVPRRLQAKYERLKDREDEKRLMDEVLISISNKYPLTVQCTPNPLLILEARIWVGL